MGFASTMSENGKESPAQKLLGQLSEGLQMILGALKNYSVAYEALGGMRGMFLPFSLVPSLFPSFILRFPPILLSSCSMGGYDV